MLCDSFCCVSQNLYTVSFSKSGYVELAGVTLAVGTEISLSFSTLADTGTILLAVGGASPAGIQVCFFFLFIFSPSVEPNIISLKSKCNCNTYQIEKNNSSYVCFHPCQFIGMLSARLQKSIWPVSMKFSSKVQKELTASGSTSVIL